MYFLITFFLPLWSMTIQKRLILSNCLQCHFGLKWKKVQNLSFQLLFVLLGKINSSNFLQIKKLRIKSKITPEVY